MPELLFNEESKMCIVPQKYRILNKIVDENNDGVNDNTWKPIYPWDNGDKLIIGPSKFFENGLSIF